MTTRSNAMSCPHCAKVCDAQSGHGTQEPVPGDYSLCWGCFRLAIFTRTPAGLMLRLPTPEEGKAAMENPQIYAALRAMREAGDPLEAEKLFQTYSDGRRPD